jgi:hypothetical protein
LQERQKFVQRDISGAVGVYSVEHGHVAVAGAVFLADIWRELQGLLGAGSIKQKELS